MLNADEVELRYVAAKILHTCPVSSKFKGLHELAYRDEDIRVALAALELPSLYAGEQIAELNGTGKGVFAALEMLLQKMPSKKTGLKPLVWPWSIQEANRETVGYALIGAQEGLPVKRLIDN